MYVIDTRFIFFLSPSSERYWFDDDNNNIKIFKLDQSFGERMENLKKEKTIHRIHIYVAFDSEIGDVSF